MEKETAILNDISYIKDMVLRTQMNLFPTVRKNMTEYYHLVNQDMLLSQGLYYIGEKTTTFLNYSMQHISLKFNENLLNTHQEMSKTSVLTASYFLLI